MVSERNDFKITIGFDSEQLEDNPVCIDRMEPVDNKQRYNITCSTVMRGRYVTFIRDLNGKDPTDATLCEVVVMGTRIIGIGRHCFTSIF